MSDAAVNGGIATVLEGPVVEAAQALLGMRIRTAFEGKPTEVVLTEVEAYAGSEDPASHAYRGRNKSNPSMFGPPGTLYVYRSYGMHWCMNIVTAPTGLASAVLLRAGTAVEGESLMAQRRRKTHSLADGPGKLCQALGVTGEHDGTSVLGDGPVQLLEGTSVDGVVLRTARIGISKAKERPWRFVVATPAG